MFEIRITKTEIKTVPGGREWERTGASDDSGGEKYAYTPEIEIKQKVERVVLKQTVDALDLPTVIAAINNLQLKEQK